MALATHSTLQHFISAEQCDRSLVDHLLARAAVLDSVRDDACAGKISASLFYEPSTRTRLSFEAAMVRRGGQVIGSEAAGANSSAAKGESLEDTIRVVSTYADVVVLRHPEDGAAARAAAVASVPVINAGDGCGEHPTQALLDLFCIQRELGAIDGVHVAICGDLRHGRTVHSLVRMLALYRNLRITFVAPEKLQVDAATLAVAQGHATVAQATDVKAVAATVDVVYQTRLQNERFDAGDVTYSTIDAALMECLPQHAIVMHPLPRRQEIDVAVDGDPRAAYFRQAQGGVAVRMAVLEAVLA